MKYDLPLEDPIYNALFKIASKREIEVVEVSFPEQDNHWGGFLIRHKVTDSHDIFLILLNRNHLLEERTFSLAHELGHYALHKDEKLSIFAGPYCTDTEYRRQKEEEADYFAGRIISFIKRGMQMKDNLAIA